MAPADPKRANIIEAASATRSGSAALEHGLSGRDGAPSKVAEAFDAWRADGSSAASPCGRSGEGRRLLYVVNDPAFFLSHRRPVALGALAEGYDVHVATPVHAESVETIRALGLTHHPIPLSRGSRNPLGELRGLASLVRLMVRLRPDIVHNVTIKPVIWGGIAARVAAVPATVSAISGMGYVFIAEGMRARALRAAVAALYRLALGGRDRRIIFQNADDRDAFAAMGLRLDARAEMIRGSGVDLAEFAATPEPAGTVQVLMPARVLIDKGAVEFVDAARILRAEGVGAQFVLAGDPDLQNPANVPADLLARWKAEGLVTFPGHQRDIARLIRSSHIVVLPSYREGLPKALIEAAACGRPVVTTDVPGCRDAIDPGRSGLLVPVRDARALAEAIRTLVEDSARRNAMGRAGRELAERAFRIEAVVAEHLRIYRELRRPDRQVSPDAARRPAA